MYRHSKKIQSRAKERYFKFNDLLFLIVIFLIFLKSFFRIKLFFEMFYRGESDENTYLIAFCNVS